MSQTNLKAGYNPNVIEEQRLMAINEYNKAERIAKRYNSRLLYHFKTGYLGGGIYEARISLKDPADSRYFINISYEYEEGEDYSRIYINAANDIYRKLKVLGVK